MLNILGKSAGTHFYKKFLLKKSPKADISAIPLDIKVDISQMEEVSI